MVSHASRISLATLGRRTFGHLDASLHRLKDIQEQLASGKRVSRPSDDPVSVGWALHHRLELTRVAQYQRNISDARGWLDTADQALQQAHRVLQQVRDIVLQGTNAPIGASERAALASQVDELRQALIGIANTRYLDRPVFGGTTDSTEAYDDNGQFLGDLGAVERAIGPDAWLTVAIPGPTAFGAPPADVFSTLSDIASGLRFGSPALGPQLDTLDQRMAAVLDAAGLVGARQHLIEGISGRLGAQETDLQASLAEAEDVDLARAVMDLMLRQAAYQAALAATERVIQPSLLDFLR
jgi:flagellar hook-associated protein 3 FlgL